MVSLQSELEFVESYVFLQKIRFQEKLTVSIQINNAQDKKVIPLSLQMLVENAIKHNIISKEEPLVIEIFTPDEDFIIVRNNIHRKPVVEDSIGVGIDNIRKRYEFFTRKTVRIREESGFYIVELPLIPNEK
jgi:LytS/YehU family sensor histidine kinase